MYYLLKNNRIIDTNDKTFKEKYTAVNGITHYSIETPNETHHHYSLGGGEYENNTYEFHSASIKKQSENVFDLIEVGDLVMVDRAKIYPNFYTEPIIEISQVFYSDSHHSLCVYPRGNGYYCPIIEFGVQKGILTIYKPNSNGDYIKVWEKKEE